MSPAGRRPGRSTAAEDILAAARALFAERGYQGTTIRSIATRAGVNQALIRHYYGSKEQLFAASLRFPATAVRQVLDTLRTAPAAELGERLARVNVALWRDPETRPQLQAFVRAAATSTSGAAAARQLLGSVLIPRLTSALGVDETRAAMAASVALGFAFVSSILDAAPLAALDDESAIQSLSPLLHHVLVG